jgi:hypothetical protein
MVSLLMKLAPDGRHMAVEPTPEKARWLRKKFPEVEVRAEALDDLVPEDRHIAFMKVVVEGAARRVRLPRRPSLRLAHAARFLAR